MKADKEAKLSLLLTPVNSLYGEEGQWKAEGRDEINYLFLQWTFAKLGGTENTIAGHHSDMNEKQEPKKESILSDVISQCI